MAIYLQRVLSNFVIGTRVIAYFITYPDYLSISEANYDINSHTIFPRYRIEVSRLHINNTVARCIILIRNTIPYVRRYYFENPYILSIWIKISINRNTFVNACSY